MSISDYAENKLLAAVFNNVAYSVAAVYVKLHTADPGETGATAPAANTTRAVATFAAASGGSAVSNADVTWTNVPTGETYSHISLWDASTAGNCLWSGALTTPKAVSVGDTFLIPTGQLTVSLD